MFGFFVIIAAMALTIFYFTIDKIGKRSDVDKVIDFLEDLVEMDALRIEIGSNCGQKALTKSDPVKTKTKNKKKKDKKRKKNDSEILQLINKIDKKLEKDYTFANISRNHYEKIYKEEILNSESAFWQELQKNPVQALSVRYSVPEWMISLWEAQYGEEKTESMLERLKNGRPLTIRLDSRLTEEEKAQEIAAIEAEGVTVQKHQLYADAWNLEGCEGIGHLPGFAEGLFYAQDVSSMLAVEAAGISCGMTVMDLCSAPGGKTTLAARKAGSGKVICGDVSERKAALILENTDRMKCSNVSVNVWDASVFMEQYKESADVVLLDVPCSGLGVIGRKKEIRYRVTKEDLAALVTLQKKIVDACWQYVKPGGILLYSTCTLDVSENEEMVRYVTEKYPFEAESIDPFLPECLHSQQTKAGFLQLFLGEWDTDGFFMARLRRKK